MHQTDVEHAQQLMSQREVQNQADFRAMTAELEWKKVEFTEEQRFALDKCETVLHMKQAEGDAALSANQAESDMALHAKQAESNAAIRAEQIKSNEQQAELDAKWAAWVNQLQAEQAKKQKDVNDDFACCIADLQQHECSRMSGTVNCNKDCT